MSARALLKDLVYLGALAAALPAIVLLAAITPMRLAWSWPGVELFLVMVLAVPILEEIVFRAGLQDALSARTPGRVGALTHANIATATAFCALHLWRHPPLWALATFFPALMFGLVYERHHRRLAAPILLHAFYNAAYLSCLRAP